VQSLLSASCGLQRQLCRSVACASVPSHAAAAFCTHDAAALRFMSRHRCHSPMTPDACVLRALSPHRRAA
jgi:hypothetical protein